MGIDVRFYYGSLVAILIFFGLGVLVGIGISREPSAEFIYQKIEQQLTEYRAEVTREVGRRDKHIAQLRQRVEGLQTKIGQNEQLIRATVPLLVAGRLSFRNVAVVITAPDNDLPFLESLTLTLQQANAHVRSTTRILANAFLPRDVRHRRLLEQLKLTLPASDRVNPPAVKTTSGSGITLDEAIHTRLVSHLASLLRYGDPRGQLKHFVRHGWLKASGDYSQPVGVVVLIGSAGKNRDLEDANRLDVPLIRFLKQARTLLVGTETNQAATSVMEAYQKERIPTVDNVDSIVGQVSLVYALYTLSDSGKVSNYGWKATAEAPFPKLGISK